MSFLYLTLRAMALVVLLAIGAGCSGDAMLPLLTEFEHAAPGSNEARPIWPSPPEPMRIAYLGSIRSEDEFNPRGSFWRRLAAMVTGAEGARFIRPAALCIAGATLAVADPGASAVHVLNLETRSWTVVGANRDLVSPVGVACLPDGRIVVADSVRQALVVYAPGSKEGSVIATLAALERPTGLAYEPSSGMLWVAETLGHRVRALDLEGREVRRFGSRGVAIGELNHPTRLAADGRGGVWVTDSLNFRVQHFDGQGRPGATLGRPGDRAGSFARPRGLAIDSAGRVFAVDALLDAVQIFDAMGSLLLVFGGRGAGPGEFWLPSDVALDRGGHVFVSDSYNQRIQVFAYHPPEEDAP